MRSPERIPLILNQLEEIWLQRPELRLGQMLLNIVNEQHLYYIEDDNLVRQLRQFYLEQTYQAPN